MQIISVSNIERLSDGTFDCLVETVELGTIPFTASANDAVAYGAQLHADILAGVYGAFTDRVDVPDPLPVRQAQAQRERDAALVREAVPLMQEWLLSNDPADKTTWENKVDEVKAAFPIPTV